MNSEAISLVRASWRQVQPIATDAAALFYDNLFDADPALRSLFKGDMRHQGGRLMQMIGAAVAGLDDLPGLVPVLHDLGRRHATYGVRDEHYDTVGTALVRTLAQGLGDGFTPAVRGAWTEAYGALAAAMMTGAHESAGKAAAAH